MNVPTTSHAAKADRRPYQCPVQISWQFGGETKTIRGKCVDLSPQGARIECPEAIDVRSIVYMQAPGHGLMGNATVRYCRRTGMKYTIGLLFSAATSQADKGRQRCVSASQESTGKPDNT